MKTSRRLWAFLLLVMFLMGAYCMISCVLIPLKQKKANNELLIVRLESTRTEKNRKQKQTDQMRQKLQVLRVKEAVLKSRVPDEPDQAQVLTDLYRLCLKHGLELLQVREIGNQGFQRGVRSTVLNTLSLHCEIQGPYWGIKEYLMDLEKLERLIQIEELSMVAENQPSLTEAFDEMIYEGGEIQALFDRPVPLRASFKLNLFFDSHKSDLGGQGLKPLPSLETRTRNPFEVVD